MLFVVVDKDAPRWRDTLATLHTELFPTRKSPDEAPVRLEVIDRATDEALQRLIAAGLISRTTRASRPLLPGDQSEDPARLTPEEIAEARTQREAACRKLKLASLLAGSGFETEARAAMQEAIQALAIALAVQKRLPKPAGMMEALQPPLSLGWGAALESLKAFLEKCEADWQTFPAELMGLASLASES